MGCCYSVEEKSVALVEAFGAYKETATPGCVCLNPFCGEVIAGVVSLKVQMLDVDCETKTRDNVFVTVVVSVQYHAKDESAYDAFYKLSNPTNQIRSYVFDVIRGSVPKIPLDQLFEVKEELAQTVKQSLGDVMKGFGYEILQTLIVDLRPAKNVCDAMNKINANERLKVAQADISEAKKIQTVKDAEADAESKYLAGVGIARQRKAIVDGMKESVTNFSEAVDGTNAKTVMDLVLITQYFDTLKDLGSSSKKMTVFVPHAPGSVADVAKEIRGGMATKNE